MIGSGRKKRIIFEKFVTEGFATEKRLSEVACPVGIDIQAVSVPEIAVSIAGQLVEKRAHFIKSLLGKPPSPSQTVPEIASR
jgi:xanthine dehydrogenase accessory factor